MLPEGQEPSSPPDAAVSSIAVTPPSPTVVRLPDHLYPEAWRPRPPPVSTYDPKKDPAVWVTHDKRALLIVDMSDDHLLNLERAQVRGRDSKGNTLTISPDKLARINAEIDRRNLTRKRP